MPAPGLDMPSFTSPGVPDAALVERVATSPTASAIGGSSPEPVRGATRTSPSGRAIPSGSPARPYQIASTMSVAGRRS